MYIVMSLQLLTTSCWQFVMAARTPAHTAALHYTASS